MSLCSLSRSDRIATGASCSDTEGLNVCSGDSLPVYSSSLKRTGGGGKGSICVEWPVKSTVSINNSHDETPVILLIASLSHLS